MTNLFDEPVQRTHSLRALYDQRNRYTCVYCDLVVTEIQALSERYPDQCGHEETAEERFRRLVREETKPFTSKFQRKRRR